ncbi:hypothetical protein E4U21_003577 [Claviceps maximensis]|nr:hypothetical protein E4U21_003577 [Claviceps maximensis]
MSESAFQQTKPLISSWSSTPFPALSLSAAGLLVLADLDTVAQRTRLTGGSSWLDVFVLAPGLHYQQAVDELGGKEAPTPYGGVTNAALARYLGRFGGRAQAGSVLTLHVGVVKRTGPYSGSKDQEKNRNSWLTWWRKKGIREACSSPLSSSVEACEADWFSHLLYLGSPALTLTAGIFMTLLQDWWGLAFMAALMLSRGLNIWSIKQRASSSPSTAQEEDEEHEDVYAAGATTPTTAKVKPAPHTIDLGNGSCIILRGSDADVRAVTTQVWLRHQTVAESYLEATAKVLVYLVAAFSGNQTQAGSMVLMALLLTSAALLALSNAHASGMEMNGRRVARMTRHAVDAVDVGHGQDGSC